MSVLGIFGGEQRSINGTETMLEEIVDENLDFFHAFIKFALSCFAFQGDRLFR